MEELKLKELFQNLADLHYVHGDSYDKWQHKTVVRTMSEARFIEAVKQAKLLTIPAVMLSLPEQDEIDEQIDKYAFRVPYDGSNNFYDDVALKHYKAGIEWLLKRLEGNGA